MLCKKHLLNSLFIIIILIFAACEQNQEGNQTHDGGVSTSESDLYEQDSAPLFPPEEKDDLRLNYVNQHEQLDVRDFQLVGGPERDVREPSPVSNNLLQQQFPDTLVLHGDLSTNRVALTFDDGPDVRFTPQVLDILERHDVQATFFLLGARAKEHSDIVRRMQASGHAIGNHTYWHPNLPKENIERLEWELEETQAVLVDILGYEPRLFRAPYGALNEEIVQALSEQHFTVVGWDVDSVDWKQPGADMIKDNVLSNVGFGSIILMHDGGDWSMDLSGTAEALDEIITKLKADGTEFVTVPELIGLPEAK